MFSDYRDTLIHKISELALTDSGVTCYYYRLGDELGFKSYRSEATRDYNYKLQKLASLYGLAPKAYDRMELSYDYTNCYNETDKRECFGYFTEHAFVLERYLSGEQYEMAHNECSMNHQCWKDLASIGIVIVDNHYRNFGQLNGKQVAIDFGEPGAHCTFTSPKRPLTPDFRCFASKMAAEMFGHKLIDYNE